MKFYRLGRMYARKALFPPVDSKIPHLNWFGNDTRWDHASVMRYGISPRAFRIYGLDTQKEILQGIVDSAGYVVNDELRLDVANKEAGDWLVHTFEQLGLPTAMAFDKRKQNKTIPGEKARTVTIESTPEIIKKVLS